MSVIDALLEERRGYVVRGLTDRIAQVDKALAAAGYKATKAEPEIEAPEAHDDPAVETAVKRGPGRPRKS
jgi:hypothetical protein